MTVIVGEIEAESKEEAVQKLRDEVEEHIPLCCECEERTFCRQSKIGRRWNICGLRRVKSERIHDKQKSL